MNGGEEIDAEKLILSVLMVVIVMNVLIFFLIAGGDESMVAVDGASGAELMDDRNISLLQVSFLTCDSWFGIHRPLTPASHYTTRKNFLHLKRTCRN